MGFYTYANVTSNNNNTVQTQTVYVKTSELTDSSGHGGPSLWQAYLTDATGNTDGYIQGAVYFETTEVNAVAKAISGGYTQT
jgi:hypothetical protein